MRKEWEYFPLLEITPCTESQTMTSPKIIAWTLILSLLTSPSLAQTLTRGLQCVSPLPHDVDPRRSLFVTELDVLDEAFSLDDLRGAVAADFYNPRVDAKFLWKQLWDT